MAERRMFAKTIIDSDAFLDMPLSSQALYFHLSMRADDDGFVNNPNKIAKVIGANKNDLDVLIAKRFILTFDSGVIVIKHWRINNYLQNDRLKPTIYQEEMAQLTVKDNKAYTEIGSDVYKPYTQSSIEENRVEENRVKESNTPPAHEEQIIFFESEEKTTKSTRFTPPTLEEVTAYCKERNNNINPQRFISHYQTVGWMVGKNKMKDWKAAVRTWESNDYGNGKPKQLTYEEEIANRTAAAEAYLRTGKV